MFKKILIANRGEIAVRIIRACKEMGIETVAIYSTADRTSLHTQLADEAICIGGPKAKDSYLNMGAIIEAAIDTGCEAIHPGFGFLSENSEFANLVKKCHLTWIGPDGDVIDALGNKSKAREMMIANNVPVVPGSEGSVKDFNELKEVVDRIGYPVLIKASAGGGGRGMRRAYSSDELEEAYNTAKAEAKAAFGDDDMYVEKLVINPKHVEFQILADNFGNTVYLGERDCSIQRRNQKMIEESPCKILTEELRQKMGNDAVKAAKAARYTNAGTVEFVLAPNGDYYFIEMNTRIQVEHPVTEMVTGIDLIKEQIRIAEGLKLRFKQEDIKIQGHAIECRINVEDPHHNFAPCPGKITTLHIPGGMGVRVDTHVYQGYEISPFYDSMVAKVIVHAPTRIEAIKKMRRVLSELVVDGVKTNQTILFYIFHSKDYVKGKFNTGFMDAHLEEMLEDNG